MSYVLSSICLFFLCELQKIFFLRDIMDNQCANLYSCNCLWVVQCYVCILLKDRIFFLHVYPQLRFFYKETWFMSFYLSPPLFIFLKTIFSQNLFCFSYFYRGRKVFLTFVVLRGSCCSSYRVELFYVPLILYFLLSLLHMFTLY